MGKVQVCSERGSSLINEDAFILNEKAQIYGVVDGATSVSPYQNAKGETGGYIASQLLATFFQQASKTQSLRDIVLEANQALRSAMVEAGVDVSQKADLWCAAFIIVRINETNIEYIQAGDCMLFAKYEDNTIRVMTHSQVAHLDGRTLKKAMDLRKHGKTSRDHLLPTLRANRTKANTLSGYSVLNGEPPFADFLEAGTFNRACLSKLYLISDGLFSPTESADKKINWEQMIDQIDKKGLSSYTKELIATEEADPECIRYPRLKRSDDKTGIIIDLP